MSGPVRARVNGEELVLPEGVCVAAMLERLRVSLARVAVERNRQILPKRDYAVTAVEDGDVFEVVELVGGG